MESGLTCCRPIRHSRGADQASSRGKRERQFQTLFPSAALCFMTPLTCAACRASDRCRRGGGLNSSGHWAIGWPAATPPTLERGGQTIDISKPLQRSMSSGQPLPPPRRLSRLEPRQRLPACSSVARPMHSASVEQGTHRVYQCRAATHCHVDSLARPDSRPWGPLQPSRWRLEDMPSPTMHIDSGARERCSPIGQDSSFAATILFPGHHAANGPTQAVNVWCSSWDPSTLLLDSRRRSSGQLGGLKAHGSPDGGAACWPPVVQRVGRR